MTTALKSPRVADLDERFDIVRRFVDAAQQRSESDPQPRRRADRRYHRSWPLAVICTRYGVTAEETVALHNASLNGLAFLTRRPVDVDAQVLVRLFWHDADCPHVPAIVRHATPCQGGYLIGCEFLV